MLELKSRINYFTERKPFQAVGERTSRRKQKKGEVVKRCRKWRRERISWVIKRRNKGGWWRRTNGEKLSLQSVKGQRPTLWVHLASLLSLSVCLCMCGFIRVCVCVCVEQHRSEKRPRVSELRAEYFRCEPASTWLKHASDQRFVCFCDARMEVLSSPLTRSGRDKLSHARRARVLQQPTQIQLPVLTPWILSLQMKNTFPTECYGWKCCKSIFQNITWNWRKINKIYHLKSLFLTTTLWHWAPHQGGVQETS